MSSLPQELFRGFAIHKLMQNCQRVEECLGKLSDVQVWQRFGENGNSIANLVLHLCGNIRQWMGYGVAGMADVRNRDDEFTIREGWNGSQLRARIAIHVQEAVSILEQLTPEEMLQNTTIQGYTVSKLEAVFHVVEHFSMHTGQIILLTKAITGEDLGFYHFLQGGGSAKEAPQPQPLP